MELLALLMILSAGSVAGFLVGYVLGFVSGRLLSLTGANVACALTWLASFVGTWTISSYVYSHFGLNHADPLAVTGTVVAAVIALVVSTLGVEFGFRDSMR